MLNVLGFFLNTTPYADTFNINTTLRWFLKEWK